jgi:ubiquinone/menaquinone biosynthesis C-methylase UbiE
MSGAANPCCNPWAHDQRTLELYRRRCRGEAEEMTCAAQAAEILASRVHPGETLLDVGCGGGYYLHSLRARHVAVDYHGLDYTPEMIELARAEMSPRGSVDPSRFRLGAIEDLDDGERFDNVLCFNVLTNSPHYAQPLERLLRVTQKRLLLRESLGDALIVRFTPDPYLDEGARHIRVYHNTYPRDEVEAFIAAHGFRVERIADRRSNDGVEMVVDIPHQWRILCAERIAR